MMLRVFSLLYLLFFASASFALPASALYQVDIIVFTHTYTAHDQLEHAPPVLLDTYANQAIPLTNTNTKRTYRLLPLAASSLRNEWSRLNRQAQYRVLTHFSWLQPSNNQHAVVLSTHLNNGWDIQGTLRVRQSNYYLLDTHLQFTAPNSRQPAFVLTQKQRLKPSSTYYLDHPQAGMLINVHRVA